MKKLNMLSCIALGVIAMGGFNKGAVAQDAPSYENWVGGFVQYYDADGSKIEPTGGLEDGHGLGAELGFRFDPAWGVRFELGRVLIDADTDPNRASGQAFDDDGTQLGVDIMYFLENDAAYLFSGVREQSLNTDSYRMINVGVGKHWYLNDNWRVISEVAAYHDIGQGYNEVSAKLGLAYIFGKNAASTAQPDTDGDGVYDAVDRCPSSPRGMQVDPTGCNIDMDGDGVFNNVDQCPTTPAGASVDARGCTVKDADKDGVLDINDSCPNTEAGIKVNTKGCAVNLDVDGDGVLDSQDKCLSTPSTDKVDSNGCSVFEEKEVSVALDILFANNSSIVENPDSARLEEFVAFMQRYPSTKAVIEGHTSAIGDANYNQFLSEKRANSVRTLLIDQYNIEASRLEAIGYGESRLKDTSNTAEASRVNRRIEVKVSALVETKVAR